MKKPRVLIIENSVGVTGAMNSIVRSSHSLEGTFHFTFLIPTSSTNAPLLRAEGFDVLQLPMIELRKDILSLAGYLPRLLVNGLSLRRLLRDREFELIVVNDFYNMVPSAYALLGGRIPLISYVRFIPTRFPLTLVRLWIAVHERTTKCLVAVSHCVRRALPLSRTPVHIVPNEVPPYDSLPYDVSSRIILFPANYVRGKGQEYALQAFAEISAEFPDWRLRFAGGDLGLSKNRDFKDSLQDLAVKLNIQSKVEWLDFQSDMRRQFGASSFVLVFSDSESFSMVCLEAMHCSRPVIATKCGGPEEIINDGEGGILVPVGDTRVMAIAMKELMKNDPLRQIYSVGAREHVAKNFSIEEAAKRLRDVYEIALGLRRY